MCCRHQIVSVPHEVRSTSVPVLCAVLSTCLLYYNSNSNSDYIIYFNTTIYGFSDFAKSQFLHNRAKSVQ